MNNDPSIMLEPGQIYADYTPARINLVVGSGIAVFMWDKVQKFGCVCFFQDDKPNKKQTPNGLFASHSLPYGLSLIKEAGGSRQTTTAQIFGAASPVEHKGKHIGKKALKYCKKFLKKVKMPILSEDTGGHLGRKIVFDFSNGHVGIVKVQKIRESDWILEKGK